MEAKRWKKKLVEMCTEVGTMKPAFTSVIATLADILCQRDAAYQAFVESGAEICIEKTNARGDSNLARNPRYQAWVELNTQALAYWRDLGLTPAGLKKIDEQALKGKKQSALADALKELGS